MMNEKEYIINPLTNRKIKKGSKTYNKIKDLLKTENTIKFESTEHVQTEREFTKKDSYYHYRVNKIDPILQSELPTIKNKPFFEFKYKWNPYNGEREEIDKNGSLCFDPDTLVHYFYINRLKKLVEYTEENLQYYGDAVGQGPNFNIVGRGDHRDWYLFRLPIIDGYIDKNNWGQGVTMGPVLTEKELKEIDKLANKYGVNYKKKFKNSRPSVMHIKKFYDESININPELNICKDFLPFLTLDEIQQLKTIKNINAINILQQI
jgi:hypothetical protein